MGGEAENNFGGAFAPAPGAPTDSLLSHNTIRHARAKVEERGQENADGRTTVAGVGSAFKSTRV